MKLLYIRESDQHVTCGKAVLCAIEIPHRDDGKALVDMICHNEEERQVYFESYRYYVAYRSDDDHILHGFRFLELTLSTAIEDRDPIRVVADYLQGLMQ